MSYIKTKWVDDDTIITAAKLNNIETGVEEAHIQNEKTEAAFNNITADAPESFNTLKKICIAIGNDNNIGQTVDTKVQALAEKADLVDQKSPKVYLDGERKSNFNFIENKIIDEKNFLGIEKLYIDNRYDSNICLSQSNFAVYFKIVLLKTPVTIGTTLFSISGETENSTISLIAYRDTKEIKIGLQTARITIPNITYEINKTLEGFLIADKNEISVCINGVTFKIPNTLNDNGFLRFGKNYKNHTGTEVCEKVEIFIYNASVKLSQQEIEHNFIVLNNAPSIKELHSGDKKLLLSTDSYHLEMATGRTLEEDHTALLKQHAKEFTSTGTPITVNNAIKGKVISGEIKGQTVKNYCQQDWLNAWSEVDPSSPSYRCKKFNLQVGKSYKFIAKNFSIATFSGGAFCVKEKQLDGSWARLGGWIIASSETTYKDINFAITPVATGEIILTNYLLDIPSAYPKPFLVEQTDETKINQNYHFFGLSSTQAIINNNGQSYPIYEPTIQGTATGLVPTKVFESPLPTLVTGDVLDLATKTITFANKTTQVLADEQLEAYSAYKKVILLNKVGNVVDTFSLSENGDSIYSKYTGVMRYNSNCTTRKGNDDTGFIHTSMFVVDKLATGYKLNAGVQATSDILGEYSFTNTDNEHFYFSNGNIAIFIKKSRLETDDLDGFNKWLEKNQFIILAELNTPVVTSITKEIMPTIQTHDKINTLSVESPVAPSEFKLVVPVDKLSDLEERLSLLEQSLATYNQGHHDPEIDLLK